jgi:hypothetical protein
VRLSQVLHPQYAALIVMATAAYKDTGRFGQALFWSAVLLLCVLLPVLLLTHLGVRQGRYADFTVPNRTDRHPIYGAGLLGVGVFCLVSRLLDAPLTVMAVARAMLITGVLAALINLFWKISIHAGSLAGAVCAVIYMCGVAALPLLGIIPVIGWARVVSRQHDFAQVVAGTLLGSAVTVGVLVWL